MPFVQLDEDAWPPEDCRPERQGLPALRLRLVLRQRVSDGRRNRNRGGQASRRVVRTHDCGVVHSGIVGQSGPTDRLRLIAICTGSAAARR